MKENVLVGTAMKRRAIYQYGSFLPYCEQGRLSVGIGLTVVQGGTGYLAPTYEVTDTLFETEIDGVKAVFQLTPGTESPAEMNTYFPDKQALWICLLYTSHSYTDKQKTSTTAERRSAVYRIAVLTNSEAQEAFFTEQVSQFCAECEWFPVIETFRDQEQFFETAQKTPPVSYTHLDVYKRQGNMNSTEPAASLEDTGESVPANSTNSTEQAASSEDTGESAPCLLYTSETSPGLQRDKPLRSVFVKKIRRGSE